VTAKKEPYRIFVSHASADKWIARVLCEKLDAIGAQTFRDDRDIDGGDDIPDRLRAALDQAHELLLLLTPQSVNRPWVLMEVGGAWLRNIRIVVVRYHLTMDLIPVMLRSKKTIDLNEWDAYLEEVGRRIKEHRR
jgi:TIR domain-containing protein